MAQPFLFRAFEAKYTKGDKVSEENEIYMLKESEIEIEIEEAPFS